MSGSRRTPSCGNWVLLRHRAFERSDGSLGGGRYRRLAQPRAQVQERAAGGNDRLSGRKRACLPPEAPHEARRREWRVRRRRQRTGRVGSGSRPSRRGKSSGRRPAGQRCPFAASPEATPRSTRRCPGRAPDLADGEAVCADDRPSPKVLIRETHDAAPFPFCENLGPHVKKDQSRGEPFAQRPASPPS